MSVSLVATTRFAYALQWGLDSVVVRHGFEACGLGGEGEVVRAGRDGEEKGYGHSCAGFDALDGGSARGAAGNTIVTGLHRPCGGDCNVFRREATHVGCARLERHQAVSRDYVFHQLDREVGCVDAHLRRVLRAADAEHDAIFSRCERLRDGERCRLAARQAADGAAVRGPAAVDCDADGDVLPRRLAGVCCRERELSLHGAVARAGERGAVVGDRVGGGQGRRSGCGGR